MRQQPEARDTETPPALIRIKRVCEITGLTKSGVYRKLREDPSFPRQVRLTEFTRAWVKAEIEEWVRAKIAERDAGYGPNPHPGCPAAVRKRKASK